MLSKSVARGFAVVAAVGLVSSFAVGQDAARAGESGKTAAVAAREVKPPPDGARDTYGTSSSSFMRIAGSGFSPMEVPGADNYSDYQYVGTVFGRYSTTANGYFLASPNLPSGALLTYLEFDNCDTNATLDATLSLFDCDYHGDCGASPVATLDSENNMTPNACSYVQRRHHPVRSGRR